MATDPFKIFDEVEHFENNPYERRKGTDIIVKIFFWIGIASWIAFTFAFIFIYKAKPGEMNFFNYYYGVGAKSAWNLNVLRYAFYSSLAMFIFSIINLLLSYLRKKRKFDKFNVFPMITLFISIIFFIFYFYILYTR